jgi:hypothetical protein
MKIQIDSNFPSVHQIALSDQPKHDLPSKKCISMKNSFGSDNYFYWTLDLTKSFLSDHYGNKILDVFEELKPYAYKADLARYCILNYYGGLYADLSINNVKEFDGSNYDMVIFRSGNSERTSWKTINGFFYSKPNSPILSDVIDQVVSNVKSRYYGHDPHFISGPTVFGRSIAKHGLESNLLIGQHYWLRYRKNKYVLPGNKVVARGKVGGTFAGGKSGLIGGNNYNQMWESKIVYPSRSETQRLLDSQQISKEGL